jgi:hypothetical protein
MQQQQAAPEPLELPESARRTAAELQALVERATRDLPFGSEPADLLAALERLAAEEDQR